MDEGRCFCVVISDGRSLAPERDSCVAIVNLFFETVQAWQSNLDGVIPASPAAAFVVSRPPAGKCKIEQVAISSSEFVTIKASNSHALNYVGCKAGWAGLRRVRTGQRLRHIDKHGFHYILVVPIWSTIGKGKLAFALM